MTEPTKIIFLDIDGPMIPSTMYLINRMCSFERKFPATTVAVMNEMCRVTGAKIVFNTTHNQPFENVADIDVALVEQGLSEDNLHQTDRFTRYPSIARDLAIKEWLARHDEVEEWVAVDDVLCADKPNMVLVEPDAGVHVGHIYQAASVLGGTPPLFLM